MSSDELNVRHEPINVDVAARPDDYDKAGHLLVTKIFLTFQGEGIFAGKRAVFLRLAGCNLGGKGVVSPGCTWCDTKFHLKDGKWMSFNDVYNKIERLWEKHPDAGSKIFVVVTGGEPMLQNELTDFLRYASKNIVFQIESNGTRLLHIPLTNVSLVVSPKIPESFLQPKLMSRRYSLLPKRILERADALKFVVSYDFNSSYHNVPQYAYDWMRQTGRPVFVSPMCIYRHHPLEVATVWDPDAIDLPETIKNHERAAQLVIEHGFQLSMQMHLYCGVE